MLAEKALPQSGAPGAGAWDAGPRPGPRPRRRACVLALALGVLPGAAGAQAVALRFHPAVGWRVRTVQETRIVTVVGGLPSLPDSTAIETTWRTVETWSVMARDPAGYRLRVVLDSSRARIRVGAGGTRDSVPLPGLDGMAADLVLGPRLQVFELNLLTPSAGNGAFEAHLAARLGGMQFEFPDSVVAPGESWGSPLRFPLGAHLTSGGRFASPHAADGYATVTLDSLQVHGADTLAYLSLEGLLDRVTAWVAMEGGVGTGTFRGRLAAAFIWSTGWNAVVAAVTSGRLEGRVHYDRVAGAPVDGLLSLTLSARHQVRP